MLFFFETPSHDKITLSEFDFIAQIFSMANNICALYLEISERMDRGEIFALHLSRFFVSDLDIWRYGLSRFGPKKISFLNGPSADPILQIFDSNFLKVRGHRNVLQHYGKYIFGGITPRKVKPSEFERIGFPIEVAPGASVAGFYTNYCKSLFCSANDKGEIQEVYIGPRTPMIVHQILTEICTQLSRSSDHKFTMLDGLSWMQVREKNDELRQVIMDAQT